MSTTRTLKTAGIAAAAVVALGLAIPAAASAATPARAINSQPAKPTVVLVHGAWADASSFAPVAKRLQRDGYTVLDAPNPLRGLSTDAASVAAFVNQATTGPVVLVGHSYGGSVITAAASTLPRVTDLVYVDAFAPATGESIVGLSKGSGSAFDTDPATVFDAVQDPNMPTGDPDLYVKRDQFRSIFAAHLDAKDAAVLSASQSPIAGGALQETLSGAPAWQTIPSWFVIGTDDKVIPQAGQLAMAHRAHGQITTVDADHLSMLERPAQITQVIEKAARTK
ncbi:alpha/beta fold hydrolase [Lysinimonas soli]|uniref:Alpha/beta fold hydrolase n=1 Tax=Lysinimonas soli TaxID=1074233 RepID=A0ABW0NUL0_9MICO